MTNTEFIKQRCKESKLEYDFSECFEVSSNKILLQLISNMIYEQYEKEVCVGELVNYKIKCKDLNGKDCTFNVNLMYDKNANFEYFTFASYRHDGTMLFVQDVIRDCIYKMFSCQTYDNRKQSPYDGCTIRYTFGECVVVNEYGAQFADKDKPWIRQRTTVFLPLKYECI